MIARIIAFLSGKIKKYKVPVYSSLICGLCAYTYMFTNKLPNHDDILCLFKKGAGLVSGRWGIEVMKKVLPNYSMPWLWGLLSIVLITIAVCYTVEIFSIKSKIAQGLIGGIVIAFPSLIGTVAYMFTSSSYAIAFLCSIMGVYYCRRDKHYWLISVLLLTFSMSVYQSYLAVSASYFVVLLIQEVLKNEKSIIEIFKKAVCCLLVLLISVCVYWGITNMLLRVTGTTFGEYAMESMNPQGSVITRIKDAYLHYAAVFAKRSYGLISTGFSQILHILSGLTIGILLVIYYVRMLKTKDVLRIVFLTVLIILLPLSINSIFLVSAAQGIHTLVLYSFISTYVFAIVVVQEIDVDRKTLFEDVITSSLIFVIISNIYVANRSFLQLHLCYENTYSFYTSLITEVKMTEGFDENSKIALVGKYNDDSLNDYFHNNIMGIDESMIDVRLRERFIADYIGDDYCYATAEEIEQITQTDEYKSMNIYPYYGSVRRIDNYIVVRLGEDEQEEQNG